MRRMREREKRVLGRLHAWWQFRYVSTILSSGSSSILHCVFRLYANVHARRRRETVKQWDAEWGRIGKEGHMWWLGSARKNWEATMGDKAWMWFCESSFLHLSRRRRCHRVIVRLTDA